MWEMQEMMFILHSLYDWLRQRVGMQLLDWSGELNSLIDASETELSYNTQVVRWLWTSKSNKQTKSALVDEAVPSPSVVPLETNKSSGGRRSLLSTSSSCTRHSQRLLQLYILTITQHFPRTLEWAFVALCTTSGTKRVSLNEQRLWAYRQWVSAKMMHFSWQGILVGHQQTRVEGFPTTLKHT